MWWDRARVIVVVVLASGIAPSLAACSCPGVPTLSSADRAYAAFEGVVIAKRVRVESQYGQLIPLTTSTFAVRRVWKGNRTPRIELLEENTGCPRRFSAGTTYLVVADGYHPLLDKLSASACSPTFPIRGPGAARHIAEVLGPPLAQFGAADLPGTSDKWRYFARTYFVSGVCVVGNLIIHAREEPRPEWDSPPGYVWPHRVAWVCVALLGVGMVAVVVFLGFAVVKRRRRKIMLAFLSAAILSAALAVAVTGYVYAERSSASDALQWQWVER